jgi:hypothetical protein
LKTTFISAASSALLPHSPLIRTQNTCLIPSLYSYGSWGEIFGDSVLATAILDRLLHHSTTINIKGESYRIKEKKKAGFFRPEPASDKPAQTG